MIQKIENIFDMKTHFTLLKNQLETTIQIYFMVRLKPNCYLVGPKRILMAPYSLFLETINSLLPPLTSRNQ